MAGPCICNNGETLFAFSFFSMGTLFMDLTIISWSVLCVFSVPRTTFIKTVFLGLPQMPNLQKEKNRFCWPTTYCGLSLYKVVKIGYERLAFQVLLIAWTKKKTSTASISHQWSCVLHFEFSLFSTKSPFQFARMIHVNIKNTWGKLELQ